HPRQRGVAGQYLFRRWHLAEHRTRHARSLQDGDVAQSDRTHGHAAGSRRRRGIPCEPCGKPYLRHEPHRRWGPDKGRLASDRTGLRLRLARRRDVAPCCQFLSSGTDCPRAVQKIRTAAVKRFPPPTKSVSISGSRIRSLVNRSSCNYWNFSVAPMMDWTDRHCRVFHRLMSRRARLYTEMLTTGAIIHGDRGRLLGFDASEHPVALQLGGSEPADLATAAKIGEDFGYDEINLNVGCPSDRVKDGRFGA